MNYSGIILGTITLAWYIASIVVSWRYENYYPINYQNLNKEKEALENELQRYKDTFGNLPKDS